MFSGLNEIKLNNGVSDVIVSLRFFGNYFLLVYTFGFLCILFSTAILHSTKAEEKTRLRKT